MKTSVLNKICLVLSFSTVLLGVSHFSYSSENLGQDVYTQSGGNGGGNGSGDSKD